MRTHHAGERVLVVDDEPINLEVARSIIEDAGFLVDAAEGGEAAVLRAQHH